MAGAFFAVFFAGRSSAAFLAGAFLPGAFFSGAGFFAAFLADPSSAGLRAADFFAEATSCWVPTSSRGATSWRRLAAGGRLPLGLLPLVLVRLAEVVVLPPLLVLVLRLVLPLLVVLVLPGLLVLLRAPGAEQ
ncbi:hypothetical protein ACW23B_08390 [Streptomyces albidoflavus]